MGLFLPSGNDGVRAWHLQGHWSCLRRRIWRCALTPWPHPGHSLFPDLRGGRRRWKVGFCQVPAQKKASQRLSGAVRGWAGAWFGAQWLPHPCRGKRVSKAQPWTLPAPDVPGTAFTQHFYLKDIWSKLNIAKIKLVTGFFSAYAHTKSFHLEVIAVI